LEAERLGKGVERKEGEQTRGQRHEGGKPASIGVA
jgi:hypothetical protein